MRQKATAARVFDLDTVERNISEAIQNDVSARRAPIDTELDGVAAYAPLAVRRTPAPSLPDYVEHRADVSEIGKLSAEAMVTQFEDAAKEIEAMASELTDAAKRCEQMVAGAHAAADRCLEVAKTYREQGKRFFSEIEACSVMTEEVRKSCEAMMAKIAAPPAVSPS